MAGAQTPVADHSMRIHVVVRGRVQAVGFRWFVHEEARRLGVAGWVKNREDGGVEVLAEGEPPAIAKLRECLRAGPSRAAVERVEELDADTSLAPRPFAILH